jgi:hypothetical protein
MALLVSLLFENAKGLTITVNAEWYKVMQGTFLCIVLHPRQQDMLWFHQDGASTHSAAISTQILRTLFTGRLISHFGQITWPTRLSDHAVPDYFLWGCIKSNIYATHPASIVDLKTVNSGVYSRDPQGNATTCYDSLSTMMAGMF